MIFINARLRSGSESDRGMSLIEVVVAISILGAIATAALGVYLSAMNASNSTQRRSVAVTIASQQLEEITVIQPATLFVGRTATVVENLRVANAAIEGVKNSYRVVGASGTATVAATEEATLDGTTYTIDTVIGTCFQDRSGGTCTGSMNTTQPTTVPSSKTVLTRVTVVVRWTAGGGCQPTACNYSASTLVDAHNDLEWKTDD